MTIVAPETEARERIKQLLTTEYAAEGFQVLDDRLDESLGSTGTRIGVSPITSRPMPSNENVLATAILVQFYGKYKLAIDPKTKVDPAIIETYAERFRRAIRTGDPKTPGVWFFKVLEVNFVNDPTGNKSRFEAQILAYGNNSALLETS